MLLTGCSERTRSAKILFLQVRKSNCENFIFALRIEHRKTCSALNQQYWRGAGNAADSGNSERIRSAKILFLQVRKSNCEKAFFALRRVDLGNCERTRSAKILFLQLRKSNCEKAFFALRREYRKNSAELRLQTRPAKKHPKHSHTVIW
ncbi:Uncharacterized protein dnm_092250 [Desulfonema magnum]|uniref:Uncharacterized protein n=1 Tax=Desulfonema magnum TaxID=45655 RepID=A0A975BWT4_9BACT|nr:Uncharacterized protein dnm_092250 [Desulfonema magnum]